MCNVGGYDEKNQIVFCDGRVGSTDARPCNLAVHQSTLAERATIVGARSHTRARAPACSGRPSRARSESGFPECYKVPQRYVDDADLPWHCEVHKVADDVAGTATSTVKLSDIVRALARGPSPQRWTHAPTSPAALTAVGVTGVWSRVWMRGRSQTCGLCGQPDGAFWAADQMTFMLSVGTDFRPLYWHAMCARVLLREDALNTFDEIETPTLQVSRLRDRIIYPLFPKTTVRAWAAEGSAGRQRRAHAHAVGRRRGSGSQISARPRRRPPAYRGPGVRGVPKDDRRNGAVRVSGPAVRAERLVQRFPLWNMAACAVCGATNATPSRVVCKEQRVGKRRRGGRRGAIALDRLLQRPPTCCE